MFRSKSARQLSHRDAGDAARAAGDWASAALHYQQHVDANPDDFDIWVQLGHANKEAGRMSDALTAYTKARALRPNDADLLLNFGRLQALIGDAKAAIALLEESHKIDQNPHALNEIQSLRGGLPKHQLESFYSQDKVEVMMKVIASGFFDPVWYAKTYPDLDMSYQGLLTHFVDYGAFEWRSPGPRFDTEWYLLQNPDLIPAVASRIMNPLIHFIDFGSKEGRSPCPPTGQLIPVAKRVLDDLLHIEPSLYANDLFANAKSLPLVKGPSSAKAYQMFKGVFDRLQRPYDYVVTIPWLIHGGAELMALHMARAIIDRHGNGSVLLLAVDYPRTDAMDWLPPGVDFQRMQGDAPLTTTETTTALFYLIQAIQPKCVINVNSMSCWELFRIHGASLRQSTRLYGCAFCRDYNSRGLPGGYADTHVRPSLTSLSGLISDNSSFFETLASHFGFPESLRERFITLYNPVPPNIIKRTKLTERQKDDGKGQNVVDTDFRVLWASRYTNQKNLDLLVNIARSAPDLQFDAWGRGDGEGRLRDAAASLTNLNIMGQYSTFSNLPLHNYKAFLYTSLWDGIPNVLLEASGAELPIVASRVGGIEELVDNETGWLINDLVRPDSYISALREIRDNSDLAHAKLLRMNARLSIQHSRLQFIQSMVDAGIV